MSEQDQAAALNRAPHRLRVGHVDLIGGGRDVDFKPGFNIIQGHITTGKTTMVRLIRALLATVPSGLPPEVDQVSAIVADVTLGARTWGIYRPRTTTVNAPVEVTEQCEDGVEPLAMRLPATGAGDTYSTFMLNALALPVVSVPAARSRPTEQLTPVSMTDWLGYCIVPGDELDTEVFGHEHPFRDGKRRWIFDLAYGFYDAELAGLAAEQRTIDLALSALEREAALRDRFLAGTPFANRTVLERQLQTTADRLIELRRSAASTTRRAEDLPQVRALRQQLLAAHAGQAELHEQIARVQGQLSDLGDLHRQLSSQSGRLTRAIVADEWLVDYDFVVCPRCGNDIDAARAPHHDCYLCLQPARPAASRDNLLAEQDRLATQIRETAEVLDNRRRDLAELQTRSTRGDQAAAALSAQLDLTTAAFVSDHADALQRDAAAQATAFAEQSRLREYLSILDKMDDSQSDREDLLRRRAQVQADIDSREHNRGAAEDNVRALESRMLQYLHELHIPDLGQPLSVRINRTTYLPEVSGRPFAELSSQGLKTLVNIAHALAHHTVAIDRGLPMPGLLILDGLSANVGSESFDRERVADIYRLLRDVGADYADSLQIIAVDNELPQTMFLALSDYVRLTLTQDDRLIRTAGNH